MPEPTHVAGDVAGNTTVFGGVSVSLILSAVASKGGEWGTYRSGEGVSRLGSWEEELSVREEGTVNGETGRMLE